MLVWHYDVQEEARMRVLVIEDDRRLARVLASFLSSAAIAADFAHDGETGLEMALREIYDVAVVDWMLPGRDGPSICRAVRAARVPTALLMLTARGQIEDRVSGLESGADDYMIKPFDLQEFLARIRALGRRFTPLAGDTSELRWGDLVLDLRVRTAHRADRSVELTRTEWDLLEYLMRHPHQALTRQQILDYVWSYDSQVQPGLVDVYIHYLRRKLHVRGRPDPIKTVRGIGYRLSETEL
jgi:two-component system OmpR family response regulator